MLKQSKSGNTKNGLVDNAVMLPFPPLFIPVVFNFFFITPT